MSSPANLMNFPDAYGQYYHPTPTPQNAYGYNPTESVVKSMSSMPEHEYSNLDYYYQTSENPDPAQQPLDYYYYDDRDTSKYSNRKGPLYDYGDYYEMDDRIRDIRKNDAIFRQDGQDRQDGGLGNLMSTALQIISLVANIVSTPDGGGGQPQTVDRIGGSAAGTAGAVAAASGTDDLDYAMGTLMAYGGKYLREIALRAWEYGTQTPVESLDNLGLGGSSSDSPSLASVVSAATATKSTAEPYLSTLSQGELEKLGLKAVAAGANPQKLQQAFATAQLQGDWSKLEKLIAEVLGIEAINSPQVGLAAVASQLLTGASGASTRPGQSQVSSSVGTQDDGTGIVAQASNFIKRIDKVINPEPVKLKPNGQPVDPTLAIRNQNIVTRFVSEFGLEQEVLQLQNTVNGVILSINNFLGDGPQKPNPDRIGTVSSGPTAATAPAAGASDAGLTGLLTSIPQAIGAASVAAIKFITPSGAQGPANKIDTPSRPPGTTSSYSEIKPMLDLNSIAMGVLGVAALGTVGFGVYSANSSKNKKRRISYRSVPDDEEGLQELWLNVAKGILKGFLGNQDKNEVFDACQSQFESCLKLQNLPKFRKTNENWIKACQQKKQICLKKK